MFTTLDHLEQHIKQQKRKSPLMSFFKEVRIFTLFFIIVFIVSNVFVNAQLYHNALLDIVDQVSGSVNQLQTAPKGAMADTKLRIQTQEVNEEFLRKKYELEQITQSIDTMVEASTDDFVGKDTTINNLEKDIGSYQLDFNTLPPTSRVIIPKIDVNTPLLQSSFTKDINTITKEDFDKDLYNGVVQYPTTPYPGKKGNTLIFGHTSYEFWKHNPYATIFSRLTKLTHGDIMQVVYEGKLYEYEVIDKVIVNPDKVNEEYLKYQDGSFLTLLGCYPIGSDRQRILVIGKLKVVK